MVMRRPQSSEYNSVRALIETVVNETFKDLFAPNPVPLEFKDEDWPLAWVAVFDEKIVGVILTQQEWVDDLWILREHRRQGVGSKLVAQGEAEIAARGHQTCRLRVVRSNIVAVQFTSARDGRLHASSRTKSTTMPCWRWLSLCQRARTTLVPFRSRPHPSGTLSSSPQTSGSLSAQSASHARARTRETRPCLLCGKNGVDTPDRQPCNLKTTDPHP
jgi:GNAT superfamily N-acetyltransferase